MNPVSYIGGEAPEFHEPDSPLSELIGRVVIERVLRSAPAQARVLVVAPSARIDFTPWLSSQELSVLVRTPTVGQALAQTNPGIHVLVGSPIRLEPGSYDVVIGADSIDRSLSPDGSVSRAETVAALARAVAPGGTLAMFAPNPASAHVLYGVRTRTPNGVGELTPSDSNISLAELVAACGDSLGEIEVGTYVVPSAGSNSASLLGSRAAIARGTAAFAAAPSFEPSAEPGAALGVRAGGAMRASAVAGALLNAADGWFVYAPGRCESLAELAVVASSAHDDVELPIAVASLLDDLAAAADAGDLAAIDHIGSQWSALARGADLPLAHAALRVGAEYVAPESYFAPWGTAVEAAADYLWMRPTGLWSTSGNPSECRRTLTAALGYRLAVASPEPADQTDGQAVASEDWQQFEASQRAELLQRWAEAGWGRVAAAEDRAEGQLRRREHAERTLAANERKLEATETAYRKAQGELDRVRATWWYKLFTLPRRVAARAKR